MVRRGAAAAGGRSSPCAPAMRALAHPLPPSPQLFDFCRVPHPELPDDHSDNRTIDGFNRWPEGQVWKTGGPSRAGCQLAVVHDVALRCCSLREPIPLNAWPTGVHAACRSLAPPRLLSHCGGCCRTAALSPLACSSSACPLICSAHRCIAHTRTSLAAPHPTLPPCTAARILCNGNMTPPPHTHTSHPAASRCSQSSGQR